MNAYYLHTDPNAFPEPFEYKPERWLGNVTPAMKRSFVPFSRGSRRCPGSRYVSSLYLGKEMN